MPHATHCPACGMHYSGRPVGARCGDTSWYTGPGRSGMVPMPCVGHLDPCAGTCLPSVGQSITRGRLIPVAVADRYARETDW